MIAAGRSDADAPELIRISGTIVVPDETGFVFEVDDPQHAGHYAQGTRIRVVVPVTTVVYWVGTDTFEAGKAASVVGYPGDETPPRLDAVEVQLEDGTLTGFL